MKFIFIYPCIENESDCYICKLSPECMRKAELELNETEDIRTESLNQIREWIKNHPDIQECRMGKSSFSQILFR